MNIILSETKEELGEKAAAKGADIIRRGIAHYGEAAIIIGTGASQYEMLEALIKKPLDWSKVTIFHLDEYVGMTETHPASFRKFLKERVIDKLPAVKEVHFINAEKDPEAECRRMKEIISRYTIDVAFVGIGENGHLAFNDPPADFDTAEPFIIVELDEACRNQQVGEGWFATIDDVPKTAVTMTISQIMKSRHIVCSVPDERKAAAVKKVIEGEVTPWVPASILQTHPSAWLYLEKNSASLLSE
jgi:glucosamine-6-phosphate deaminase